MFALFVGHVAAVGFAASALAQSAWTASLIETTAPVTAIRQVGADVYVEAGRWFRAESCGDTICLTAGRPPALVTARGGIPGGAVVRAAGSGVVTAYYGDPTGRYDHGILGDMIEGGSLIVSDSSGIDHAIALPETMVFEDLTPRIADLDGDGRNDVVTIRTTIAAGAAVAVYSVLDGALVETAATAPIGRTHRWLNVAGIADFNGDGRLDIALVKTPHIGGRLEILTMSGGSLTLLAAADGFSNHFIGSTELGMSAVADIDGDGVAELALPDNPRTTLRIVDISGGAIRDIATVPAGGAIVTAIGTIDGAFLVGLAGGSLVLVRRS